MSMIALWCAAMLGIIPGSTGSDQARPIELVTTPTSNGVRIEVISVSTSDREARYSLSVIGGTNNRSTQSGHVKLTAGHRVTLTTVTVVSGSAKWSATLHVEPSTGRPYDILKYGPG